MNSFFHDAILGIAAGMGWVLPALLANADVKLPEASSMTSLLGQGAVVAAVVVWLTQSLIPKLQKSAEEDRKIFTDTLKEREVAHREEAHALQERVLEIAATLSQATHDMSDAVRKNAESCQNLATAISAFTAQRQDALEDHLRAERDHARAQLDVIRSAHNTPQK